MRVSIWVFVCGVIRLVWPLRALRARPVHLERLILRWEGEVEQRGPSVGTLDHEKLYNWDWSQSCHTSHTAPVTLTVTVSRIVTQAQPIIHHNITSSQHSLNNANRTCHHGLRWTSVEIINWSQVSGRMSLRRDVGAPSWDDDDCDIKIFKTRTTLADPVLVLDILQGWLEGFKYLNQCHCLGWWYLNI